MSNRQESNVTCIKTSKYPQWNRDARGNDGRARVPLQRNVHRKARSVVRIAPSASDGCSGDKHAAHTQRPESRPGEGLQECRHECKCVNEREVKESVRIELVKALHQARFILRGRDIARSGFITTDRPRLVDEWFNDITSRCPYRAFGRH
jgi:hypothetical protein